MWVVDRWLLESARPFARCHCSVCLASLGCGDGVACGVCGGRVLFLGVFPCALERFGHQYEREKVNPYPVSVEGNQVVLFHYRRLQLVGSETAWLLALMW